eukprot:714031_1
MGLLEFRKNYSWVCYVLLGIAAVVGLTWWGIDSFTGSGTGKPKNLILLISDGYGVCAHTVANQVKQERKDGDLALSEMLIGQIETSCANYRVTDSAASATAYATGKKTNIYHEGLDKDGNPIKSITELCQDHGMRTGIITNRKITDATPAAFTSHVTSRNRENRIAFQQSQGGVDLLMGGGLNHFTPAGRKVGVEDYCSKGKDECDEIDLKSYFVKEKGYTLLKTKDEMNAADSFPLLGLFADGDLAYMLDRDEDTTEPTVSEMAKKALDLFKKDTKAKDKGFFLMVEGGLIDQAMHNVDAASMVAESLEYDKVVALVKKFAKTNGETLVVSVSDHETRGCTMGVHFRKSDNRYVWFPERFKFVKSSLKAMRKLIDAAMATDGDHDDALAKIINDGIATDDADLGWSDEHTDRLVEKFKVPLTGDKYIDKYRYQVDIQEELAKVLGVKFAAKYHTAEDVNVFAHVP